jgi:hypothetical protein
MHRMVKSFLNLGSILFLCVSPNVCAQDVPFVSYNYNWAEMNVQKTVNPVGSTSENYKKSSPDISAVSTTYTPSASLRKKNLANFVSKTRATDPAGADQMEQLFANGDIISQIDGIMQGKGMTASNTADAYAIWWVAAWQAVNGDGSERNSATYQAVSGQAARGFATSPQFANATDAQKQEMAEAMLVQAALIDSSMEVYANDPAMMKQLATAVKQGAKKSGLDLDAMTLTDEGFAKAKGGKTGAAGDTDKATNPASEPVATAANDTAPAGDKTTQYALIAAAGGAGLAGMFLFGKAMGKKG